jgi:glutamate 5-kinase
MKVSLKHQRLVIKLGTRVVLNQQGCPNGAVLLPLIEQISALRQQGLQVVIVSSGAVGLGRSLLQASEETLPVKQALAAIGQGKLMELWSQLFSFFGIQVAQVLLTRDDLRSRERYLNASQTVRTLLDAGVIPIINENDSVATAEIKFGDNDILACLVGGLVDANAVYNLTQTAGLLKGPNTQELVERVTEISPEILSYVGTDTTKGGTGGMLSKIEAARVCMDLGVPLIIAAAREKNVLLRLQNGEAVGTLFVPQRARLASRKRWLAAGAASKGKLWLDIGAAKAIRDRGKSLLAVGITACEGTFQTGELVTLMTPDSCELGRGLVNLPSSELAEVLLQAKRNAPGPNGSVEVVHRDHLFVKKPPVA